MRYFYRRHILSVLSAGFSLALAGCGGGGGSATALSTPVPGSSTLASSVSGVVAYGKPVATGQITAIDGSTGNVCGSATTASDGSYSMNLQCTPGPVLFAVVSGAPSGTVLDSLAIPANGSAVSGTINITPLTTLVLYDIVGTQSILPNLRVSPNNAQILAAIPLLTQTAVAQGGNAAALASAYQSALSTILGDLSSTLGNFGVVASSFDPLRTAFSANGTGIDAFFDTYPETMSTPSSLMLGNGSNAVLGVTLPSSAGATATLGGSTAGASTATTTSGSSGANGATCSAGTYCAAYLGHTLQLSELVTTGLTTFDVTCQGQVASTPTSGVSPTGLSVQVAMISGTCTANGSTTSLTGEITTQLTSDTVDPPMITYVGLAGNAGSSYWNIAGSTASPAGGGIGLLYGSGTFN